MKTCDWNLWSPLYVPPKKRSAAEMWKQRSSRPQEPVGNRVLVEIARGALPGYEVLGRPPVVLDLGGGKDKKGTAFLEAAGMDTDIFDIYNQSEAHNRRVVEERCNGRCDAVVLANVLNVIPEPEVRAQVLMQAVDALKPTGILVIQVYVPVKGKSEVQVGDIIPVEEEVEAYFGEHTGRLRRVGHQSTSVGYFLIAKHPNKVW